MSSSVGTKASQEIGEFEILNKETYQEDKKKAHLQIKKLLNSEAISLEDKAYLIQLMHNENMRVLIIDSLQEINMPKPIKEFDCLKILADIIKFILTCTLFAFYAFVVFVHEQKNDFRFLYTILESS